MKRAFTLIELLIVVAIIAILAAIAVPNFLEAQVRAKIARVMSDQRNVATAIESYIVDNNEPPIMRPLWLENPRGSRDYGIDENSTVYRFFCHYLWDQTPPNPPGNYCELLTTPIAYINEIPMDQFAFTHPGWEGRKASFWYVNFEGAYKNKHKTPVDQYVQFEPDLVSPCPLVFNAPNGPSFPMAWMLSSHGPLEDNTQYSADGTRAWDLHWIGKDYDKITEGYISLYDATNGTMSRGLICRGNAGVPGK